MTIKAKQYNKDIVEHLLRTQSREAAFNYLVNLGHPAPVIDLVIGLVEMIQWSRERENK